MLVISQNDKVDTFLGSIQRNSSATGRTYLNGIKHFAKFLKPRNQTPDMIIPLLQNHEIDVYTLLNEFVTYLEEVQPKLYNSTIKLNVAVVRSFIEFFDVDVVTSRFRRRVKLPKSYREDEQPLDVMEIRNILLKCTNRRLKAFILVLASSGVRAMEACSLRVQDADYSLTPTRIHVRKEFSKTRRSRDVYISQEATEYLRILTEWKYRSGSRKPEPDDLIFSVYSKENANPEKIYQRLQNEFTKLLHVVGMAERKENSRRHRITLHSIRRYVKGVISDQAGQDYSEWFRGHDHSVYWTKKEPDKRQIYASKCMKYVTYLDYSTLEATGKNIESKIAEKENEIKLLRERDAINTDAISALSDQLSHVMKEIELLKQMRT
jgi:integrase